LSEFVCGYNPASEIDGCLNNLIKLEGWFKCSQKLFCVTYGIMSVCYDYYLLVFKLSIFTHSGLSPLVKCTIF